MSNSSDTSPDHASEITRADNAIRALRHALEGMKASRDALEDARPGPEADEIGRALDAIEDQMVRALEIVDRETARRDAAELAAMAERVEG